MNNKYAEIIKWQEMKQNGVITEEEFEEELEDEVALLLHELNVTRSVKTLKYLYIFFIAKIL